MAASAAGFDEIPVIDLTDIDGSAAGRAALADRICQVCHEVGFMVVSGHGVDRGVVADDRSAAETLQHMSRLTDDEVHDLRLAAEALHRLGDSDDLATSVAPRGLRLLHRTKRLSSESAEAIAGHFDGLSKLQRATIDDLSKVNGIDSDTAAEVRETLARVTESAILDQYN